MCNLNPLHSRTEQNRIYINTLVQGTSLEIYMHNITRDSRKNEDSFLEKDEKTHYNHVKKER